MATEQASNDYGVSVVKIGTRRSQLAIAQVDWAIEKLKTAIPEVDYEMQVVTTMADENQVKSFQSFNSKSIWTEELEQLLVERKLDVIVHCLKDMPTLLPKSCTLGVICEREDPLDVVVIKAGSPYKRLQDLPAGSVVGTSSVRRKAQIRHFYPHLEPVDVRGNVNTRLRKLDDEQGPYSCLVLAAAGLKRIDLGHRISQYLTAEEGFLYAPGQGALALEVREGDSQMLRILNTLSSESSTLACQAEKNLLRVLEGGCSAPVGVQTEWQGKTLVLKGQVISPDGKEKVEDSGSAEVTTVEQSYALGREVAERMLASGADKILDAIRATTTAPAE